MVSSAGDRIAPARRGFNTDDAAAGVGAANTKEAAANATDAVAKAANDAKASDAAKSAEATATDVMEKVKADGASMLDKLDASIKSNKLDEGQTYVDAFEKIK